VNTKNIIVIVALAIFAVSLAAFLFFKDVEKQYAPAPVQPVISGVVEEKPAPAYSIPVNTVPAVAQIEATIKKKQEVRAEIDKMTAQVAAISAKNRQEIYQQLEVAAKSPEKADSMTIAKKSVSSSQTVAVRNPTREERKAMQNRNVVAY
jgi:hypothetical protein